MRDAGHDGLLHGLSPRLGLGTLAFTAERRNASLAVLDAWAALGGTLLDTANVYNEGESERIVGEWLKSSGARANILLLTKGGHHFVDGDQRSRLDAASINADVAISLERLGVDSVDVYLLHRDDPTKPAGEMIETLNEHVRAGVLRSIGASNWTTTRVDEANAYAEANGLMGFSVLSNYLGLVTRLQSLWLATVNATDRASRAWVARTGIPLLSWSAQSQGYFADDFDPAGAGAPAAFSYDSPQNFERRRRAFELAQKRGCSAAQIALAWVLNQPIEPIAVVGVRTPDQLRASWAAADIILSQAELDWLEVGGPEA